jgi:hypothetical protein
LFSWAHSSAGVLLGVLRYILLNCIEFWTIPFLFIGYVPFLKPFQSIFKERAPFVEEIRFLVDTSRLLTLPSKIILERYNLTYSINANAPMRQAGDFLQKSPPHWTLHLWILWPSNDQSHSKDLRISSRMLSFCLEVGSREMIRKGEWKCTLDQTYLYFFE